MTDAPQMTRWYVVAYSKDADPEEEVWTLSLDPDKTGWETDCGYPGYGLTKETADFLAAAANEKAELRIVETIEIRKLPA